MDSRLASRNEIAKITWRNLAMGQLIDLRAVPLDVLLSVRKDDREHLLERVVEGSLLFTLDQTEKCHWTTPATTRKYSRLVQYIAEILGSRLLECRSNRGPKAESKS